MNKQKKSADITIMVAFITITVIFCVSIFLIFDGSIGGVFFSPSRIERIDKNYNKCLEWINEAIPDPNEVEQRSELLKSCMDN